MVHLSTLRYCTQYITINSPLPARASASPRFEAPLGGPLGHLVALAGPLGAHEAGGDPVPLLGSWLLAVALLHADRPGQVQRLVERERFLPGRCSLGARGQEPVRKPDEDILSFGAAVVEVPHFDDDSLRDDRCRSFGEDFLPYGLKGVPGEKHVLDRVELAVHVDRLHGELPVLGLHGLLLDVAALLPAWTKHIDCQVGGEVVGELDSLRRHGVGHAV